MVFANEKKLTLENSIKYTDNTVGTIVKTETDMGMNQLGVFVPKLQMGMSKTLGNGPTESDESISYEKIINADNPEIGDKKVSTRNFFKVSMLNIGSGNILMPKYQLGESVMIGFIDDDIRNMFIYPYSTNVHSLRSGDKFTILANAKSETDDSYTVIDKNNSYGIEINTDSEVQTLQIYTSMANKEASKFNIFMDGKNGVMSISDNDGNAYTINTERGSVTMATSEGKSVIEMIKDTINIKASTLNIDIENDINIESSTIESKCDELKSKASTITYDYDDFTIKGSNFLCESNKVKYSGLKFSAEMATGVQFTSALIAANGLLAAAQFTLGGSPDIDVDTSIIPSPPNSASMPGGARIEWSPTNAVVSFADFASVVQQLMITISTAVCAAPGSPIVAPGLSGVASSFSSSQPKFNISG